MIQLKPVVHICGRLYCHLLAKEEKYTLWINFKMATNTFENSGSHTRPKQQKEYYTLSQALELVLEGRDLDNSDLEELSDTDDPVMDADYHPPQNETSSSEESSGGEDPIPQPTEASRGRKRFRGEVAGYRSDHSIATSRTPRHGTQQVEVGGSTADPEEPTPGPGFHEQPNQGRAVCWKAAHLTSNLVQFEPEEGTEEDREGWTALDYVNQYIDKDLMKLIVYCSIDLKNAARCRATGCSGRTRVRCATCKMYLCLQAARNCYTVFHTV